MRNGWPMLVMLTIVALQAAVGSAGTTGSSLPKAVSPAATIQSLTRAYSDRSLERYAALLAADYEFHSRAFPRKWSVMSYVEGLSRDDELESASALFGGGSRGARMPAARTIHAKATGISEAPDPEHPDSTGVYRIVIVRRFDVSMGMGDGDSIRIDPNLHVFHVVRGDAAVLADGQAADRGRWYIRRWLEGVEGVQHILAATKQECVEDGTEAAPSASGPSAGLVIRAIDNPACPLLPVMLELPGTAPARIEVFDVMGRLMARRDVTVAAPGPMRVEAGAGASLAPGVYWVRLSQAQLRPTSRMVVVTR